MASVQHIVRNFIATIWNNRNVEELDRFLHPDYVDYSLPPFLTPNAAGLRNWILATSTSFEHTTIIDDQVSEQTTSIIRISMEMKHIGVWRDIPATGRTVITRGYRQFRIADGKIIGHWGLVDGTALENQLRDTTHGCRVPER